jgi:hypothetical protein
MQGAHFIRKSEIAAIVGTNSGTKIVWDNGMMFTAYFNNGSYSWDESCYMLAADNPFLLSNGDVVTNSKGAVVTIEAVLSEKEFGRLIAQQFLSNRDSEN